jgi:hypothetical protein
MIEVRESRLGPDVLAEAAALLRRRIAGAEHVTPAYLEWSYCRNPEGPGIAIEARDGSRLVAHVAAMPLRARVDGAEERALFLYHAATETGYEGRGLFKAVIERVLAIGAERGFAHAYSLPNANSRFAIIERLGFSLVREIDVRVGVGETPEPPSRSPASWERIWDARTLAWRLARPGKTYLAHARGGSARVLCASGYPGILAELGSFAATDLPAGLASPSPMRPLRVWLGIDPDRRWRGRPFVALPARLRPAPLLFTFRDLCGSRVPDASRARVVALDFDAY